MSENDTTCSVLDAPERTEIAAAMLRKSETTLVVTESIWKTLATVTLFPKMELNYAH